MLKKNGPVIMLVAGVLVIAGCSNSPVSVSETDNTPTKTAALDDVMMQDVAASGNYIWGLSTEAANANGDYYIYYFNTSTNNWVSTLNYGKKISVTPDGKCYHFNSNNNIWYCTTNGNGQISNPPQSGTMTDITAGVVTGGSHSIWVIIDNFYIYRYDPRYTPAWTNMSDWWSTGYPIAIGCGPIGGETPAIISDEKGVLIYNYVSDTWMQVESSGYYTDVAISGAWVLFPDCYGTLYKNIGGNTSTLVASGVSRNGICGDDDYYYYIQKVIPYDNKGYVHRGTNTWN